MLDIKVLREDVEKVIERLNTRGGDFSYLREVVELDEKRRVELKKVEDLKSFRNEKSKKIGFMKRNGEDTTEIMKEVDGIGAEITIAVITPLSDLLLKCASDRRQAGGVYSSEGSK